MNPKRRFLAVDNHYLKNRDLALFFAENVEKENNIATMNYIWAVRGALHGLVYWITTLCNSWGGISPPFLNAL